MCVLHWEYFADENPSDRHYAQGRGERGREKQRQFRPRRELGRVAKLSDDADEQIRQRAYGYSRQDQEPFAQPVYQQDREYISHHAERRVHGL